MLQMSKWGEWNHFLNISIRLLEVPKMTVCALKFSETARKRIIAVGGKCLTFD